MLYHVIMSANGTEESILTQCNPNMNELCVCVGSIGTSYQLNSCVERFILIHIYTERNVNSLLMISVKVMFKLMYIFLKK